MIGFAATFFMAAICFMVSFFSLPLMIVSPTKFATTFSLGSRKFANIYSYTIDKNLTLCQVLAASSFALLKGPRAYLKDLFTAQRLPWTAAYFGSLLLTLYFSLHVSFSSHLKKKPPN
jgi:hypothetical protein